jgi:[citrate (pro-3S)-lyase] ligase
MTEPLEFATVDPVRDPLAAAEIDRLLAAGGLEREPALRLFLACRQGARMVACAGLDGGVVKCVAVDPGHRGGNLGLTLMHEVACLALERGHSHLFLYTRPGNVPLFRGCGYHPLVEVPGWATLMENTPVGLVGHLDRLRRQRREGARIGGIVMNANPFTLGHRHLVLEALGACDWLHLFVVSEDASAIASRDRLALVRAAVAGLGRVTVHPGSRYLISKGTFPTYFIKDRCIAEACQTAVDLLLFRQHLAPALGITHRFVGTEPFCKVTRKYNEDMRHWLAEPGLPGPPVAVAELPRLERGGLPVSASEVRRLWAAGDFARMAGLVPPATLEYLRRRSPEPAAVAPAV